MITPAKSDQDLPTPLLEATGGALARGSVFAAQASGSAFAAELPEGAQGVLTAGGTRELTTTSSYDAGLTSAGTYLHGDDLAGLTATAVPKMRLYGAGDRWRKYR